MISSNNSNGAVVRLSCGTRLETQLSVSALLGMINIS